MVFPETRSQASDPERQIPRPRLTKIGGGLTEPLREVSPSYDEFYRKPDHELKSTNVVSNEKKKRPATGSFTTYVELLAFSETSH